jgi:hypothetical protein
LLGSPPPPPPAGVKDGERIVAIVNVGEPADVPPPKKRESASAFTTWIP